MDNFRPSDAPPKPGNQPITSPDSPRLIPGPEFVRPALRQYVQSQEAPGPEFVRPAARSEPAKAPGPEFVRPASRTAPTPDIPLASTASVDLDEHRGDASAPRTELPVQGEASTEPASTQETNQPLESTAEAVGPLALRKTEEAMVSEVPAAESLRDSETIPDALLDAAELEPSRPEIPVKPPERPPQMPKVEISDEAPVDTAQLRSHEVFTTGDPEAQIPDVVLASAPLNPMDRPRANATRVGIYDGEERVGALNVVQTPSRTWLNDVRIEPHRQGERLAVAAYMGIVAKAHDTGRSVQSDPAGLSPDSTRVWESLTRRGIAVPVEGEYDQHGHPRFVTHRPS